MADNDILQGFQLGFQSSLQRQRLKSEAALQRLQEQQIAQAMALKMQENALQNQFRAEMATAVEAARMASEPQFHIRGPQDPNDEMSPPIVVVDNPNPMRRIDAARQFILPVIGKYQPDKVGQIETDMMMNEVRMQNEQNEALRLQGEVYTPSTGTVVTPSGEKLEYFKNSPRSAQIVAAPSLTTVTDPETGESRQILRTGASGAKMVPQDIGARQTKQKMLDVALQNPDLAVDDPDNPGGKIIPPENWAEAARRMSLQAGTRTEIQKKSISIDSALARVDDALKNIESHPEAIGPVGMARGAAERVRGWAGIKGETTVSKARHDLALTFTELADSLRVDSGNMSLYERQKLESVGDPSRWQESAQTAQDMMENIQKAMIGRKLRLLRAEGKMPDEPLLRRIPSSEIAGLVRENLLSVADAMRWK